MKRKSVFLSHFLLCFICALYIGTPAAVWGQLANFGLPKQQTEPVEIVTAHGVLSVNQVHARQHIPDGYRDEIRA